MFLLVWKDILTGNDVLTVKHISIQSVTVSGVRGDYFVLVETVCVLLLWGRRCLCLSLIWLGCSNCPWMCMSVIYAVLYYSLSTKWDCLVHAVDNYMGAHWCFKYRHYVSDVISVKTNQTVKKEEEEGAYIVDPPLLTPVLVNRLLHFLCRQGFKQVPSLVIQRSESQRVIYKLHLFDLFCFSHS